MNVILQGTLASLAAGSMTAVGALPVLFGKEVSTKAQDTLLGFAAGVMLAASFFSLIFPAIEVAELLYGSVTIAAAIAVFGFVVGVATIAFANEWIPHRHFVQGLQGPAGRAS